MARSRGTVVLLLLAALAIVAGTAAVLFSGGGRPVVGGPHRITRRPLPSMNRPAGPSRDALERAAAEARESAVQSHLLTESTCPGDLTVRVLRAVDNSPVEGARVVATDLNSVWTGFTDAAGEIRYRGIEAGMVPLRVSADGLCSEASGAVVVEGGTVERRVLLFPVGLVEGRVLAAADRSPVKGARIAIEAPRGAPGFNYLSAKTAEDGTFRLNGGRGAEWVDCRAEAQGFVPQTLRGQIPVAAGEALNLEFLLDPACVVRGVVRDPNGQPVAKALVLGMTAHPLQPIPTPGEMAWHERQGMRSTFTDATGAYTLEGLAAGGVHRIVAVKAGFAPSAEGVRVHLPADAAEQTLDLTLRAEGALFVSWTTGQPGNPITGQVTVFEEGGAALSSRTGAGSARIVGLPSGPVRVSLWTEGWGPTEARVEIRPGEDARVELSLGPKEGDVLFEGTVTDAAGAPLARARVAVVPPLPGAAPSEGRTGADGRFRIAAGGVAPGPVRLRAWCRGFAALETGTLEGPQRDLRLILHPGGSLRGRFVLPEKDDASSRLNAVLSFTPLSSRTEGVRLKADVRPSHYNSGEFSMADLPPGPGMFAARVGRWCLLPRRVEVPESGVQDLGDLLLGEGLRFEGRIVDPEGRPISQARVLGGPPAEHVAPAVTDARGVFVLQGCPEGPIEVVATAEGFLETRGTSDVRPGAPPAEIRMLRGGLLRVEGRDSEGVPLAAWHVRVIGSETDRPVSGRLKALDALGRAEFRVPAGAWRALVGPDLGGAGPRTTSEESRVEEGGEVVLRVSVER